MFGKIFFFSFFGFFVSTTCVRTFDTDDQQQNDKQARTRTTTSHQHYIVDSIDLRLPNSCHNSFFDDEKQKTKISQGTTTIPTATTTMLMLLCLDDGQTKSRTMHNRASSFWETLSSFVLICLILSCLDHELKCCQAEKGIPVLVVPIHSPSLSHCHLFRLSFYLPASIRFEWSWNLFEFVSSCR